METAGWLAHLRWELAGLARYPRYAWRLATRPERVRLHGVELALGGDATPALRRALYAERYERGEARCVAFGLAADDVVLEVGAGAGFLSTLCALRVGSERVTAVEANPALLPRIRETWAANGVAPRLVHAVLAREAGEAELFVASEFVSSSLRGVGSDGPVLTARVPQLAVNALLREVAPTFLAIDIEGGEAELLPAIDWRGIRALALELHPHRIGEAATRALLARLADEGFREHRAVSSTRKKLFSREAR